MRKLMTALGFAIIALASVGVGAAQSELRITAPRIELPVNAGADGRGFQMFAHKKDHYPYPTIDSDDTDLRFPVEQGA